MTKKRESTDYQFTVTDRVNDPRLVMLRQVVKTANKALNYRHMDGHKSFLKVELRGRIGRENWDKVRDKYKNRDSGNVLFEDAHHFDVYLRVRINYEQVKDPVQVGTYL